MENLKYCQSCGMPLDTEELYGTNADKSKNEDYCKYCYENGAFKDQMTMDEMIEFCVPGVVSSMEGMTEASARQMMQEFFPTLKRWQTA